MQRFLKTNFLLLLILIIGATFRTYGLNWDQGFHLHPDERAIVMFTTPLQFPKSIAEFLSPQSLWNPHFFAYGSFPIYFLKIVSNIASAVDLSYTTYDKINLIGRFFSATFDIGTLTVLFFLAKKLFNTYVGLLAAFFYAVSVLPIQLSHFYAVDTPLTFFILLTLYQLIKLYEKPTLIKSMLVGFFFGLSLATKTSALVLIASIGMAIAIDFLLMFIKQPHKPHIWFPHLPKFIKRLFIDGVIILLVTLITFIIFEPYALIDFQTFWQQQLQQRQMTYDAFTFPYTLQYVGKISYFYELKNIFLFGLGPILATLSFLGTIYVTIKKPNNKVIIILTFFWIYFIVVGNFAIGFMRYMLPLYPLFCLFSAVLVYTFFIHFKSYLLNHKSLFIILYSLFFILVFIWPVMFIQIYTKPNTRILASEWIYQHVKPGSALAREHWDDGLPIGGNISYNIQELPIYEMGNPIMQDKIYQTLNNTDYIIIASNRLYVPLQRIAINCQTWHIPQERCPKNANDYYNNLFNETLGFSKIGEFSMKPMIPLINYSIDDSSADESFTVYDHPKVMIFKKNQ